ncbi:hypothetical protein HN51_052990 [Arachis hypogaea]|nr:uncharacterized protein DS421_17g601020 [Arachis hypogaea]
MKDHTTCNSGGTIGVKDGEEPAHVTDGGFVVGEDLAEVSNRDGGDDGAEDGAALTLADKGENAVEVLGGFGDDTTDKALVEKGLLGEEVAKQTIDGVE